MTYQKARVPVVSAAVTPKPTPKVPSYPFSFGGPLSVSKSPLVTVRYDMHVTGIMLYLTTPSSSGPVSVQLVGPNNFIFTTANLQAGQHFQRVPLDVTIAGYDANNSTTNGFGGAAGDTFFFNITSAGTGAADLYGELEIG